MLKPQVVGINVATSGNQIGFLVPHDKLLSLFAAYKVDEQISIEQQMLDQLTKNQEKLMSTILANEWQLKQLGESLIPTSRCTFY